VDPGTTYRSALFAAHKVLGSLDVLSARLCVDQRTLMQWMAGQDIPPLAVFLQVVDIIVDHVEAKLGPDDPQAGIPVIAPATAPSKRR
jgi:hypothetical protein